LNAFWSLRWVRVRVRSLNAFWSLRWVRVRVRVRVVERVLVPAVVRCRLRPRQSASAAPTTP
jgi:hypothetical protein